MDCGRISLVKLCGLRRIKCYNLHMTAQHARIGTALSAYILSRRPPTSLSAGAGRMLRGQSTNETTWAVSDVTVMTVTWN